MNKFNYIKKIIVEKPLRLDCGQTINNFPLAYETYGKLNKEKNDRFKVVLTGGNANFFKKMFKNISITDDLFTSRALNYIVSEVNK